MARSLVISYLVLRQAVGAIGVSLPVVLPAGVAIFGTREPFQSSISAYYSTDMVGVFVAALTAIGVFLLAYLGYEKRASDGRFELSDNAAGNLAGVSAIAVERSSTLIYSGVA